MAEEKKSFGDFFSRIANTLTNQVKDLTTLDVTTAVGDAMKIGDLSTLFNKSMTFSELEGKATVIGLTRIDVDGDIIELLHGSDGKLTAEPELLEIHKKNVAEAVENWNRFFRNLVEISATIAAIADPKSERVELIRALKTNIEPLKKE